jgi:hypothetical protein
MNIVGLDGSLGLTINAAPTDENAFTKRAFAHRA